MSWRHALSRLPGQRPFVFPSIIGAASFAALSSSRCSPVPDAASKASAQPPLLYRFLEKGGLIVVLGTGGVAILGMLFLSQRSTKRTERVMGLLKSAERVANSSPQVVGLVGRVYTKGKYKVSLAESQVQHPKKALIVPILPVQLAIDDVRASGFFSVDVPSRNLTGSASITAKRKNASEQWQIEELSLEFPEAAVTAANAARAALATSAGYGAPIPSAPDAMPSESVVTLKVV
jgi:hypothetical protein